MRRILTTALLTVAAGVVPVATAAPALAMPAEDADVEYEEEYDEAWYGPGYIELCGAWHPFTHDYDEIPWCPGEDPALYTDVVYYGPDKDICGHWHPMFEDPGPIPYCDGTEVELSDLEAQQAADAAAEGPEEDGAPSGDAPVEDTGTTQAEPATAGPTPAATVPVEPSPEESSAPQDQATTAAAADIDAATPTTVDLAAVPVTDAPADERGVPTTVAIVLALVAGAAAGGGVAAARVRSR